MAPPKAKGQKMGLGEFLTDSSLGSWADEMEDAPLPLSSSRSGMGYGGGDRSYGSAGGSMSSYADRGYSVREQLPLPSKPPFTVHLGNMSFDATEGDIQDFFAACEITSVRIVEDKVDRKPKGFGYAEFATLDGLKKALDLNGSQFQGRNMRVSVAEPQKDRNDVREIGDWTRKGPLPDIAGPRRGGDRPGFGSERGGFSGGRNYEAASDAGGERGGRRYEQGDGKVRDFGNWERKGPLTPTLPPPPAPAGRPSSNDGPRERRNSPAWGEGRSQEGSRPPRREFVERPAPPPTAAEQDNQWRARMRPDPPAPAPNASPALSNKELSAPSSPAAAPAAPAAPTTRPKLNLQKRTVSQAEPSPVAATPADSKASPFGAARPIDTAAREKEIEEKMKVKKEHEDKVREEKRAADEKAKEERRVTKEAERAEKAKERANGQSKEPEQSDTPAARNYQILRRDAAGEEANDGEDENANGEITEDKAVKPKEIVRDIKPTNGEGVEQASAENLDEEGWSTVSKPQKNRKGGNAGARALAS